MNMKFVRTWAMLALVMVIGLSVTGGTIAWFTDSVTSSGNEIKSGTLDMKLYAVDTKDYTDGFEYTDAHEVKDNSPALFDYKLWEPGYTSVKHLKIENAGNLAFKWHLNVKPAMSAEYDSLEAINEAFKLAKVIEVYVAPSAQYTSFAELQAAAKELSGKGDAYKAPTLFELADASVLGSTTNGQPDPDGAAWGILLPEGKTAANTNEAIESVEYVVALHMQESAGNEYQNLSVGEGFILDLRAEQYTYEADSFGKDYDANAAVSDMPSAFYRQLSAEEVAEISFMEYEETSMSKDDVKLNAGYFFATADTPAMANNSKYEMWHADFVVSFDKDVAADTIGLAGYHTKWGTRNIWLGFDLNAEMIGAVTNGSSILPANQPIRLLGEAGMTVVPDYVQPNFSVNYYELCNEIFQLYCGAYLIDEAALADTTMTVELRLYEVEDYSVNNSWNVETGNYVTAGTFSHKF